MDTKPQVLVCTCARTVVGRPQLWLIEKMKGAYHICIYNGPILNVAGILNSAHECVRPSLLDFLFSDPPLAGGHYYCYCCKLPPTNNFKLDVLVFF